MLKQLLISETDAQGLRYQLLHRTVAALLEAKRYQADAAMMLVHSFSAQQASFDDFSNFSRVIGAPVDKVNSVSQSIERSGVRLSLAWVADKVRSQS